MTAITNRHSDSVARHCSRCGAALEDAASRECGVGPVCRKKDNAIFSRMIPADLATAGALILSLSAENFHSEISSEFDKIKALFLKKMQKVRRENVGSAMVVCGGDFRKVVDWFDVSLSYPIQSAARNDVIKLIESLGYQALAGVLRGDVCMSPAKLYVEDGFICLTAKSNKYGYGAMRRTVPGVSVPRWRGDSKPYKAPLSQAAKFIDVVYRYWPFVVAQGDIETAIANAPVASAAIEIDSRPAATFLRGGLGFTVNTPWHGTREEMTATLDAFKALPYRERKYEPVSKSWTFKMEHLDKVKQIVGGRYQVVATAL